MQYNESDFAFVSRLMEHEGIYYFFKHSDGAHKMDQLVYALYGLSPEEKNLVEAAAK